MEDLFPLRRKKRANNGLLFARYIAGQFFHFIAQVFVGYKVFANVAGQIRRYDWSNLPSLSLRMFALARHLSSTLRTGVVLSFYQKGTKCSNLYISLYTICTSTFYFGTKVWKKLSFGCLA